MTGLLWVHLALTWALVGLIWTVQVVHYPLFRNVAPADFKAYHSGHTQRIGWLVGPLMLGELITGTMLWTGGTRDLWFLISLGLLAVNWISTALIQMPLHKRLAEGFDEPSVKRLVQTNWVRTVAWTLRAVLLIPLIQKG